MVTTPNQKGTRRSQGGSARSFAPPKKRKTPWVRRVVSTLILLLLLAGLIALVVGAVRWVGGVISAEHERSSVASLPQPVNIGPCNPDDIGVAVTPSAVWVPPGEALDFSVELVNEVTTECSFQVSDLNLSLAIGGEKVWTPTTCSADERLLLLAPDQEWVTSFRWDGGVYVDCARVNLEATDDEGNPIPAKPPVGAYEVSVSITDATETVTQEIVVG